MGTSPFLSCERKSSLVCLPEQTKSGEFLATGAGDATLDQDGEALRAESDQGFCIDEHHRLWSPSRCESTHPGQGSILSASLAPHPWRKHVGYTSTEPQASPEMLDEPRGFSLPRGDFSA